ncbi:hypothetical protein R3P38DRAFT_3436109 [Favolaschia claudopus]|uniref:Uncharacterized protein n=1 Tax=Favolaschia claudopus TaxID=2862362 RepID=A0AAV9ZUU5_9AGAR
MASSSSSDKNAEFARLFNLFEMLANRKARMAAAGSTSLDDTYAITIPADLEPVVRSLATVVPPRDIPSTRRRRNTVAALGRPPSLDDDSDSESDESIAKFPLGDKSFMFTFKMMIHKLYQVDEWATKVREVLEKSQIEYKPLAEQEFIRVATTTAPAVDRPANGRVHFKAEVSVGGRKSLPLAPSRTRSHSVAALTRPAATNIRAPSAATPTIIPTETRATKKRCVGRRKSVSGPLSPASPIGEGWIYDAAVSAAELPERVPADPIRAFPSSATTTTAGRPRPRPRYQSLETGNRKMGFGPRRIVSAITSKDAANAVVAAVDSSAFRTATKRRLSQ